MTKEDNSPDLVVSRMPDEALDTFKRISNKEFKGDYGMYIKFLQDVYLGVINTGVEHLEEAVNNLNKRLNVLESKPLDQKPKKDNVIKMGNGRVIHRG